MIIRTYDKAKGKNVVAGKVIGRTFVRRVKPEHYHKLTGSYALQDDVIEQLKALKVKFVKLKADKRINWLSTLKDWLKPYVKILDYGHGRQHFLPTKYMTKKRRKKK